VGQALISLTLWEGQVVGSASDQIDQSLSQ
jgi:hypothetical protein